MTQPIKVNGRWDLHGFFDTINHTHLSYLDVRVGLIDLMLVERKNGLWFIIDEEGHFSENPRIFQARAEHYTEPAFFASYDDVSEEAIAMIAQLTGKPVSFMRAHFSDE